MLPVRSTRDKKPGIIKLRIVGWMMIILLIQNITVTGAFTDNLKDNHHNEGTDSGNSLSDTQGEDGNQTSSSIEGSTDLNPLNLIHDSSTTISMQNDLLTTESLSLTTQPSSNTSSTTNSTTTDLSTSNSTIESTTNSTSTLTQQPSTSVSVQTTGQETLSTEITSTEIITSTSTSSATSSESNNSPDTRQSDTSTITLNTHTVNIETSSQLFTSPAHKSTVSKPTLVVTTTSSPDKLIEIQITEIFVDKDGKEQIELKVLGNKEKLSKYSVHFFSGKEESHYYKLQLSGLKVNEDGYLLVTNNKIKLIQYLKEDGSVSLAVYYNKPNKASMDKEGLVDAVVITTDQHHVPANLHTLTRQYGNIITTKPSDIKNGFTAMKCSDSEAWKKGRQSTLGKPNPTCRSVTTSNSSNKIKVTIAVVSTCLVIFFFIVILVIVYMRRKQEGIRIALIPNIVWHFQLSPLSEDDDELILNMEHPSEDYSPGSEPTFGNDYYSKMRKL